MRFGDIFERRDPSSTDGLQNDERKNMKVGEIALPPTDENGRLVPDRSRKGQVLNPPRPRPKK
ncbi:MAG: hypothetical protein LBG62_03785 [Candidatus Methanoplasma sp.]|nr:hypothetical protein [Candidatus Methanoplasma sp.]